MFGQKNKKIEQKIKEYPSVKEFQKDQKKLAKDGWYVKAQSTKHEKKGFFRRTTQEIILVTFEREVK